MGATKVYSMFTCGFHVLHFVCKSVITYFGTVCTPRTHRGVVTVGRSFICVQYRRESPLCKEAPYKIRRSGLRSGFPNISLQGSPLQNSTFGFAFGFSENLFLRKPLTKCDFRVNVPFGVLNFKSVNRKPENPKMGNGGRARGTLYQAPSA